MNDFLPHVRKGFLHYKEHREKIEALIPHNYSYMFSADNMEKVEELDLGKKGRSKTVYDVIDRKMEELKARGITEDEIGTIVSTDLNNDLKMVTQQLSKHIGNKDSILKIVDRRIVTLVEKFFQEAAKQFDRVYSESSFYGLCLHLSATLERSSKTQRLADRQIVEIVDKYNEEYGFSVKFALTIDKEFDVHLPIEEIIFITMFICDVTLYKNSTASPVILVAMHGNSTASSIAEVVNTLSKSSNIFAFDLPLDKDSQQAYDELKAMIQKIDQGKGVLILYDMGSLKTMGEMIMKDTGIEIRLLEVPATLIALDSSRKASFYTSLDEVYDSVVDSHQNYFLSLQNTYQRKNHHKVIITLCMSGIGGAVQMKSYLEKHLPLEGIDIVPLAISNRDFLLNEVNKIKKNYDILYVIGTYNPQLHNIPFISISKLFETPVDKLEILLALENVALPATVDFNVIYEYLSDQLPNFEIKKLKKHLPRAIAQIKREVQGLSQDQELGLFLHIACMIHRVLTNEKMPHNISRDMILNRNKRLYNALREILLPLEESYHISIGNDELANIISIIKQL